MHTPLGKLPVTEYENKKAESIPIIYISGDGGMNTFSESFCKEWVKRGFSVAALDSKKYFWASKTPEQFAADISFMARYYMDAWKSKTFLLVGYSFGADVAAFLPRKLPSELLTKAKSITLMALSESTDFEVKLMDIFGTGSTAGKYHVSEELNNIKETPILCLFPEEEENPLAEQLHNSHIKIEVLSGNHHFGHHYAAVVDSILKETRF